MSGISEPPPAEGHLREAIKRISQQLCRALNGNFDVTVKAESPDETLQKLELLINFVLDDARRNLASLQVENDETQSLMRAVVDAAADGVITMDERGTIESFNRAACHIFGYSAEEIVGKNFRIMVPADQQGHFDEDLKRYLEAESDAGLSVRREVVRLRRDGSSVPVEFHASSLRLADRRLIVVVARDITERKQAEAKLAAMTDQLVEASRQAGMAELATGVLHNVGNVLNSVNVSTTLLFDRVRKSKVARLAEVSGMFQAHAADLGKFVAEDEKGKRLPAYLGKLAEHLAEEQSSVLGELGELAKNIEHIKTIINTQQANARVFGVVEAISLCDIVDDALTVTASSFERYGIELVRDYAEMPPVTIDKQRMLQILVNLVRNAKHAALDGKTLHKRLIVRLRPEGEDCSRIEVNDNGVGIPAENLTRIFSHGFTTKKDGHGFGLHSSALAAKEIGGSLSARSGGLEQGATFTLIVPNRPAATAQGAPLAIPTLASVTADSL